MSEGKFKLKKITNLSVSKEGETELPESDYAVVADNWLYQFEYFNEESKISNKVTPGTFSITSTNLGFKLEPTSFVQDSILEDFVSTEAVEKIIYSFFKNIPLYKEFGFEVAKRSVLLWGPAGSGKTTVISKITKKLAEEKGIATVIWPTDKLDAYDVKEFIKTFKYEGVEVLILVAEDFGGTEAEGKRFDSNSSLLSLLDNQEKTFTIPTMIIATTNYPQSFLGNILNRPGRFEDKIKVDYPSKEARKKLLEFFSKSTASTKALELMESSKCKEFTPAHIREVYVRSRLREKSMEDVIEEILKEIELFNKNFEDKKGSIGF